jgi:hypothetical protein
MSMGPFAGVDDDRLFGSVSDDLVADAESARTAPFGRRPLAP